MDVTFLITTYHRQESCQRLVDTLRPYGNIVVIKDGFGYNVMNTDVFHKQQHLGKTGYWKTVNKLFSLRVPAKYYIMLPDDFMPCKNMIEQAILTWEQIKDDKKICLNLYADRIGQPCWTNHIPVDMGNVYQTQWVDMCFICEESFFTSLGQIPMMLLNWRHKPNKSSGVGRYISLHLKDLGFNLYQVKQSLAEPTEEHFRSQMKANI
jgi:hypothetical protein